MLIFDVSSPLVHIKTVKATLKLKDPYFADQVLDQLVWVLEKEYDGERWKGKGHTWCDEEFLLKCALTIMAAYPKLKSSKKLMELINDYLVPRFKFHYT